MTDTNEYNSLDTNNLVSSELTDNKVSSRTGKELPIKKDRSKVPYTGNQSYTKNAYDKQSNPSKSLNEVERSRDKQPSDSAIIGKPKRKKRVWHSVPDYTKIPDANPSSLEIIYDYLYENGYEKELKELRLDINADGTISHNILNSFYQNVYNVVWDDENFWDNMGVIPEDIKNNKKLFLIKIALSTWKDQFNQPNKSIFDLLKSKK